MPVVIDSDTYIDFRIRHGAIPDGTWQWYEYNKNTQELSNNSYGTRVYSCKLGELIEWAHLCKNMYRPFVIYVPGNL